MNIVIGLLGFMAICLGIGLLIQYFDEQSEKKKAVEDAIKKAQDERNRKAREAYELQRHPSREAPVTVGATSKPVTGNWKATEPVHTPQQPDILLTALVIDSFSEPSYTEPARTESYASPSYSSCDYGSSSSSDSSSSYDSSSSSCDSSSSY